MNSGSFDGIANKFDQNIYGTSKGRLRHELLLHYLKEVLESDKSLTVLDAGGGTGVMCEEFAKRGHHIEIADVSEEALDIARQRLASFSNVTFTKVDMATNTKVFSQKFDVILCHALLEWLPEPLKVVSTLLSFLKPNGLFSLSFFNRDAMLFNNALYGNFDYIEKGMKVRNVVRLNPHNPQQPTSVLAYLDKFDSCEVILSAGLRCFHDYMRDPAMQSSHYSQLLALEKQYGASEPYKRLGKYFYIQVRKLPN